MDNVLVCLKEFQNEKKIVDEKKTIKFRNLMVELVQDILAINKTNAEKWCVKNNPVLEIKTKDGIKIYTYKNGYKGLQTTWC